MVGIPYPTKGYRQIARQFADLENGDDGQLSPSGYVDTAYYSPSVETISPNMRFAPRKDLRDTRNRSFWASSATVLPSDAPDEERLLAQKSEQYTMQKEEKDRKSGAGRRDTPTKGNDIKIIITEPEPVASRHGVSLEFDPLRSHPVDLNRETSIKQSRYTRNPTAISRSAEPGEIAPNESRQADLGPRTTGPSSASRTHRHHHLRKSRRPTLSGTSGRQDLRAVFQNGEQSIRRATLRAALSASRAVSAQAPAASFSANVARTGLVSSRIQAIRFFSQSPRVLNIEEPTQTEQTEQAEQAEQTETAPAATEEASTHKPATATAAFVRNIVFDATEEHIKGAFEKFGEVTEVFLARDARGLSKGYAFVTFATKEALEEACAQVDGSFWHGRRISVQPRRAQSSRDPRAANNEPSACLFIGNIPYETTDAELNNIFVGVDGLKDVRVAVDRATGWPRGFAHADFTDVDAAVKALEKLQGTKLGERDLKFDYAQPAASRPAREDNGERREFRPRRDQDGGNRGYNRDGGNRSYNRDGGNRSYNRDGGNRSYNRDGGNRSYNRRDQQDAEF
ncbi:hypothetical protein B0T20DRAFT_487108 [Sordaria brevicollis]|uniref:RRM domain-containing protein n=1 Tax=Sordaria brevicollis TaxID=83679 RepID=A0AAE0P999_SORBR|nr:hypothetical protein B0T20DRAFT_487108 [Sordaria brevicollis]